MVTKSYVGLSLNRKLKDELQTKAKNEHRTLSNMIEHGLTEWLSGNKSDQNSVAEPPEPANTEEDKNDWKTLCEEMRDSPDVPTMAQWMMLDESLPTVHSRKCLGCLVEMFPKIKGIPPPHVGRFCSLCRDSWNISDTEQPNEG